MKKSFFIFTVATILLLTLAMSAQATYPPHGQKGDLQGPFFSTPGQPEPDGCAQCHRAHTAVGSRLAFDAGENPHTGGIAPDSSPSAFCLVCHGKIGNLANTNVVDGIGYADRKPGGVNAAGALNGGKFLGATSRHEVDSVNDSPTYTKWGGGTTGDNVTMGLTCGSCHDPHGTPQYRLLKTDINGDSDLDTSNTVASLETGFGTPGYTPDFNNPKYKKGNTAAEGISASCWKCHVKYKRTSTGDESDPGTYDAGAAGAPNEGQVARWRHPVNIALSTYESKFTGKLKPHAGGGAISLPLEKLNDAETDQYAQWMGCLTCHVAHGTTATMTDDSLVGPSQSSSNRSALLRKDNRGVCEDCHFK